MDPNLDADSELSSVMGTETLKVDQTANLRNQSKISPIWHYGSELRALDTPSLEKYWLCSLCRSSTIYKITGPAGSNTNTSTAMRHLFACPFYGGTSCRRCAGSLRRFGVQNRCR